MSNYFNTPQKLSLLLVSLSNDMNRIAVDSNRVAGDRARMVALQDAVATEGLSRSLVKYCDLTHESEDLPALESLSVTGLRPDAERAMKLIPTLKLQTDLYASAVRADLETMRGRLETAITEILSNPVQLADNNDTVFADAGVLLPKLPQHQLVQALNELCSSVQSFTAPDVEALAADTASQDGALTQCAELLTRTDALRDQLIFGTESGSTLGDAGYEGEALDQLHTAASDVAAALEAFGVAQGPEILAAFGEAVEGVPDVTAEDYTTDRHRILYLQYARAVAQTLTCSMLALNQVQDIFGTDWS